MSERTFDDFDEHAGNYRSVHTQNIKISGADSFYFARMKVECLQAFESNQSLRVLDFGCGDGTTEKFMLQYFPSWKIDAIDVSEKSIAIANQQNLSVNFSVFDGKRTAYIDEQFDIIFMAGVLHHIEFGLHKVIMEEITRLLKKGGRLYLFEHNPFNPLTKHLVNTCVFDKDAKLLKSGYTDSLITNAKLQVTAKRYIIFFPRKGILSKLIFLEKYLQWLPIGGQYFIRAMKPL